MDQNCSGLISRPQRVLSIVFFFFFFFQSYHSGPYMFLVRCCVESLQIREYTLSSFGTYKSLLLNAKPDEIYTLFYLSWKRKKRVELLTVFRSVAGPSHFKQHQQITNNHLFKASCPLGASPVFFTTFLLTLFTTERILCHMF